MSPFDFLNAINFTKKDLIADDPACVKHYVPYVVNRTLSYFPDTLLAANDMNLHADLAKDLQFAFLLNTVRRGKRFTKWSKPDQTKELEAVQTFYGFSTEKAKRALALLTPEQVKQITTKVAAARGETK